MADLSIEFAGIKSPNPFWLASAPPANTGEQVMRAFDLGWGGAVWKTLGDPIVNVSSRFGAIEYGATKVMGLNNIELITDRPLDVNLREMAMVKKRYPKHALIGSLMTETKRDWQTLIKRVEDVGVDGLALDGLAGDAEAGQLRDVGVSVQRTDDTCVALEFFLRRLDGLEQDGDGAEVAVQDALVVGVIDGTG